MERFTRCSVTSVLALALSQTAFAGSAPFFVPLTHSEGVTAPDSIDEINAPWQAPAGVAQTNLTSMEEIENDVNQSVQRIGAGTVSSMFDMLAFDPTGKYLFIPHETPLGAGLTRYDMDNDTAALLFAGDQNGAGPDGERATADDDWSADFGAFDPSRYTPNGTVILAEEWSGLGRVVEICNPFGAAPADPVASSLTQGDCAAGADWRVLPIANVSHEGINFSLKHENEVIYFIDEDRSGSIYKMVLTTAGDYAGGGQTFVLKADNYLGDPEPNWNDSASGNNAPAVLASRFGPASWVPITDANGNPLPGVTYPIGASVLNCAAGDAGDECRDEDIRPGRVAADDVGGTPFGRPEDMAIGMMPNGNEILYVTTTSENGVISIEETRHGPYIRSFASEDGAPTGAQSGTAKNADLAPTTGTLNSPDNLAIDSLGNIYIIEDAPNSNTVGGDVWFARDMDNDGVAESLDHFLSLQVAGSEATGMIFNPADPTKFVVAVQHPTTTDLSDADNDGIRDADGFGDAVWEFDLADTVPPVCSKPRHQWTTYNHATRRWVRACSNARDYNAIRQIKKSDKSDRDFPNP
ncbi:MAG TPA: hypothetical protein DCF45_00485 [Gammaproteobacteria bacterium]|nr:hypothetical protein [Gammaproteobacteria bacterium]